MAKKYWSCLIGAEIGELPWGSDFPLRMAVREAFEKTTGVPDEVCASGWGIDEERYELLRIIGLMSTSEIKTLLEKRKSYKLKKRKSFKLKNRE